MADIWVILFFIRISLSVQVLIMKGNSNLNVNSNTPSRQITQNDQRDEIIKSMEYLLDPKQIVEVRILKSTGKYPFYKTQGGYFTDSVLLADALLKFEAKAEKVEGFYFTLNPVKEAVLARADNVLIPADNLTSDTEIESRRFFPIDIDPERPRGTSSTNVQHEMALALAEEIAGWLSNRGWPVPVFADSGNGAHLLYRIDLSVDDDGVIENALKALKVQFQTDELVIDAGNYNPSRIWKLYGTWARKGSDIPNHPHRQSHILWEKSPAAGRIEIVPESLLKSLAAIVDVSNAKDAKEGMHHTENGRFNLETWIEKHKNRLNLRSLKPVKLGKHDAEMWSLKQCPFFNDHRNSAYIYRLSNGTIGFKCFGNRCVEAGHSWGDFREKIEPGYKSKAVAKRQDEKDIGDFFLDTELQTYTYVDLENRDVITYKNKGDWKNKFKLLNRGRNMPDPFREMKSVYDPGRKFGFFKDEYGMEKFNRFKPSEYWFKEYDESYVPKITPVFDALYKNVFNSDDTVKKLLAKMLQDHKRFLIIPVIINEEGGAGKGIFEQHVIAPILGMGNCSLNLGQEDLETPYNDYLVDRLYIGFHETEDAAENAGIASKTLRKIKRMFDPTITIEKKYIPRVSTTNHATCLIYSNNPNPVSISTHDRRTYVVRSMKTKLQNTPVFRQTAADTAAKIDTFQKRLEELRLEIPDVVCKLKRIKVEPNFGKNPKSTKAKKDLQDRSKGPIQNFVAALLEFDTDTLRAIAEEKHGNFPEEMLAGVAKGGILTTNTLRELVGKIGNGRWTYETVRKLMPSVRPTKYNGYTCWKVKKRPEFAKNWLNLTPNGIFDNST